MRSLLAAAAASVALAAPLALAAPASANTGGEGWPTCNTGSPTLRHHWHCDPPPVVTPGTTPDLFNVIVGSPRRDRLGGGEGRDAIFGFGGNDLLIGRGSGDWLFGGSGNDVLRGGFGADVMRGGPGFDTCYGSVRDLFINCEVRRYVLN